MFKKGWEDYRIVLKDFYFRLISSWQFKNNSKNSAQNLT
jgi:hypothetical protein